MTCSINYVRNSPFKEKAEEIHYEIEYLLKKDKSLTIVDIGDKSFFKAAPESISKFNPKSITQKYGNVLVFDNDFVSINALESEQYLNYVVDKRLLGLKDYPEMTLSELIEQDKNISPLQFSDSLKKVRNTYVKKYENLGIDEQYRKADEDFKEFLNHSDIIYKHVLENDGMYVGVYYQKGETPNFHGMGNSLDNAIGQVKLDRKVINEGKGIISNDNTSINKQQIIFAAPTSGKTTAVEQGADIIDFDTWISKDTKELYQKNKKEGESFQNYKARLPTELKQHYINSWLKAKETGKDIYVSQSFILDIFKEDFDKVYLVDKEEFRQRLKNRGSYNEFHFEDWYNNLVKATEDTNVITLGKGEYIGDLLNKQKFNLNKKEEYKYPALEEYMKSLNYEQKVLLEHLLEQLAKVAPGFEIKMLDKVLGGGEQAFTDFRDSVIQIGSNADFSDITEEIFHVLIESIDQSYLDAFDESIVHTEIYKEVLRMYGNHPDYDAKRLKREAVVKIVTQMSNGVDLSKFMTTKNETILTKFRKAITNLLKVLFDKFSKVDSNDFYNLTESIMYSEVPYVKKDLTDRGRFESRNVPKVELATQFTSIDVNLTNKDISSVTFHINALVNEKGEATPLGNELMEIVEINGEMSTKNTLGKIKLYIPTKINDAGLTEEIIPLGADSYIEQLKDLYPDNLTLTLDTVVEGSLLIMPLKEDLSVVQNKVTSETVKNKDNIVVFQTKTKDANGNEVITDFPNFRFYTGTASKPVSRFTTMKTIEDDYSEALKFFENLKDSDLSKNISKLGRSVEFNLKRLTEMGLVNTFNSNTHAVNSKLIKQLKKFYDNDNLLFQATALYSTMNDFGLLFQDLEKLLRTSEYNSKLTLKDLNDISQTLKSWDKIMKSIKDQLLIERENGKTYPEFEAYIAKFRNNSDHLKTLVNYKSAQQVAAGMEGMTNRFNEQLRAGVEELREIAKNNPKMKERLDKEIAQLEETLNRQMIADGEILNQLLQTERNDIDTLTHKFNLNPMFDRYLTNIRFSTDPILASFGANMEKIYHDTDVELQALLNNFLDIGKDIEKLGGEVAVGKMLTRLVKTFDYTTEQVIEDYNGVPIKYFKKIKIDGGVVKKQIINQWGNKNDYFVQSYGKSFGELSIDIDNLDARIKAGIEFENIITNEGTKVVDLKKEYNRLYKIKRDFITTNFHQVYTEQFYNIRKDIITRTAKEENLKIEEVEKIFQDADEEKSKIQEQRTAKEQSLLNTGRENKEQIALLRGEIGDLTNQIRDIYSATTGNAGIASKMLKKYREQYDEIREKIPNEEVFINDLKILIDQLDTNASSNLIRTLQEAYTNNGVKRNLNDILNDLINLHIQLNSNGYDDEGMTHDKLLVRRFLDEALWYHPTKEFYDTRKSIYNEMTVMGLILKADDFKTELVQSRAQAENNLKLKGISNDDIYKMYDDADEIDEEIFNSLLGDSSKNGHVIYQVGNEYLIFEVKNGKPVRSSANAQYASEAISVNWAMILDITKKYRDSFGYIYSMPEDEQAEVIKLEQAIYDTMASMMNDNKTKGTPIRKFAKERMKDLSDRVSKMQTEIITESYYDSMHTLFSNYADCSLKEFRKVAESNSIYFNRDLNQLLNSMKDVLISSTFDGLRGVDDPNFEDWTYTDFLKMDISETKRKLFGKNPIDLKKFNESDFKILQGLFRNHVVKSHQAGTKKNIVVPSYNYRKITPADISLHIEKNLDNKYKTDVISDALHTDKRFTKEQYLDFSGNYQLKKSPLELGLILPSDDEYSNYQLIKAYNDLQLKSDKNSEKLKRIHSEWVEKLIIGNQRQAAIDNSYKIANNSYLGYTVPYLEKQYSELGWWEGMKEFGRDVWGLRNPNETGEFSVVEYGRTIVEHVKDSKNILEKFVNVVSKFLNLDGTGKYYRPNQEHIPVEYTYFKEGGAITDNIFLAHASYMSSFLKAKNINKDLYKINSLRNTLRDNDKFKEHNQTYKRLEILEKNINSEIYKNNIGEKNFVTRFLRMIKRLMVYKSQSTANIVGWTKNLEAGLLQNYIHSLTVSDNFIWDKKSRIAEDTSSTIEAFKLAYSSFNNNSLGEETLVQYLNRQINPQMREMKDLFRNKDRFKAKSLIFEEKLMFGGLKIGETIISYQMMLDIVKRLSLKDKEGKEISFLNSFEQIDGRWKIKEGITTANGKELFNESHFIEIKKLIDRGRLQTMGHSKYKGTIFNNSYVRSLFFFVNYLVPLMQNVLTLQRRDFYTNQIVENFNLAFLKYIAKTLQYLTQGTWYWNYMTSSQRRDVMKAIVMYSSLYSLVMLMKYLFGFDPDEKDAYKKLKKNNELTNFLLTTTLKTASEIEQLSLANPLSKTYLPVITANYNALKNPTLLRLITDLGKTSQLTLETGLYGVGIGDKDRVIYNKGNKNFDIEKGDWKLLHALNKFYPFRKENYDFVGQVRMIQTLTNN